MTVEVPIKVLIPILQRMIESNEEAIYLSMVRRKSFLGIEYGKMPILEEIKKTTKVMTNPHYYNILNYAKYLNTKFSIQTISIPTWLIHDMRNYES
jgi:hypothetical protein